MRIIGMLLLGFGAALLAPVRGAPPAAPQRIVVAGFMANDSLSWALAERAAGALRSRLNPAEFAVVPTAIAHQFIDASGYGGRRGVTTEDVRELMRSLRADALVDVQAARRNGTVAFSVLQFRGPAGTGYRGHLQSTASPTEAADSIAATIARDSAFLRPR